MGFINYHQLLMGVEWVLICPITAWLMKSLMDVDGINPQRWITTNFQLTPHASHDKATILTHDDSLTSPRYTC